MGWPRARSHSGFILARQRACDVYITPGKAHLHNTIPALPARLVSLEHPFCYVCTKSTHRDLLIWTPLDLVMFAFTSTACGESTALACQASAASVPNQTLSFWWWMMERPLGCFCSYLLLTLPPAPTKSSPNFSPHSNTPNTQNSHPNSGAAFPRELKRSEGLGPE